MITRTDIPEVLLVKPKRFEDDRGWFSETFNIATLDPVTGPLTWVQDNQSLSRKTGTVRGLHLQIPPFAQDKLVRCIRGAILDVAVDIRHGSPTYGRHVSAVLSDSDGAQLFVPKGFAHGFVTLEPDTEVAYKVTNYYSRACERAIRWNDPALGIDWRVDHQEAVLSDKDAEAPPLADTAVWFRYPC